MTTLVLITHLILSQTPVTVKVVSVMGHAELVDQTGNKPLERFSDVPMGATVQTFEDGKVSLRLPSGTLVRLGTDTKVEIAALTRGDPAAERKESLRVSVGRLWSRVTRLFGDDSKFEVSTDNAVAGVRGTEFFVETHGGSDKFAVDHGTIVVNGGGTSLTLDGPGAYAVFEGGQLTTQPKLGPRELSQWRREIGGAGANLLRTLDPSSRVNHEGFRWALVGPNDPVDDILPGSRVTDSLGGDANVTVHLRVPNL